MSKESIKEVIRPKEICSDWDGFIDPQGKFYTSRRPGGGLGLIPGEGNISHGRWANVYVNEMQLLDKYHEAKEKYHDIWDAQDFLVHVLGWCSYSHLDHVYIQTPYMDYSPKITTAQKETLFTLCKLNNDDMKYYYWAVEEVEEVKDEDIDYSELDI